ncbi:LEA type 2 family protein [Flavisolibacter tropicus]|nr:LEA type 2 family protein [Flavisolibacter tropicus]
MKIYSLLIALLLAFLSSCTDIKDPQFRRLEDFGIRKINFINADIGFNVVCYNPNSFGLTAKETALDVYVDSIYLGKFIQPQTTEVSKNAEFIIPLEGKIDIASALKLNRKDLLNREILLRANGNIKVGKAGVYITKDINYSGRHRLDSTLLKNPAAAGLGL